MTRHRRHRRAVLSTIVSSRSCCDDVWNPPSDVAYPEGMVRLPRRAIDSFDNAANPDRRPMRWLTMLLAAAAALALLSGGATRVREYCHGPEAEPVEAYLLDPNAQRPQVNTVATLLGIEYGMTVEQVDALMPLDAVERTLPGGEGLPSHSWAWDGLLVSVNFEGEQRTVSDPLVARTEGAAPYVLLPRGLVLGRSRLSDFVAVFGAPTVVDASQETGRMELDVGWEVSTDVRELFEVSLVVPLDIGADVDSAICSTVPYLYQEPAFTLLEDEGEDRPACLY